MKKKVLIFGTKNFREFGSEISEEQETKATLNGNIIPGSRVFGTWGFVEETDGDKIISLAEKLIEKQEIELVQLFIEGISIIFVLKQGHIDPFSRGSMLVQLYNLHAEESIMKEGIAVDFIGLIEQVKRICKSFGWNLSKTSVIKGSSGIAMSFFYLLLWDRKIRVKCFIIHSGAKYLFYSFQWKLLVTGILRHFSSASRVGLHSSEGHDCHCEERSNPDKTFRLFNFCFFYSFPLSGCKTSK